MNRVFVGVAIAVRICCNNYVKYRVRNRPAPTRRRREKKKGFEGGFGSDE